MASFITQVSHNLSVKEYVSVKSLEIGEKHEILNFRRTNTKYGEKIVLDIKDFRTVLPERYVEEFTKERIEQLNREIAEGQKFYITSLGPISRTTNLEFSVEK